jgi:hypothetical protein
MNTRPVRTVEASVVGEWFAKACQRRFDNLVARVAVEERIAQGERNLDELADLLLEGEALHAECLALQARIDLLTELVDAQLFIECGGLAQLEKLVENGDERWSFATARARRALKEASKR